MDATARTTNVFGALVLVAGDAMRAATEAAAMHGAAAPAALVTLHESPQGRSVDELRSAVGLTPSGTVRLIDRLEADGYVSRAQGSDRRSVTVALTASGRRIARKIAAARAASLERLLRTLSADERQSLHVLMSKLLRQSTLDRLEDRRGGSLPAGGWTCRLCDHAACGRPQGECPAAQTAAEQVTGQPPR